MSYLPERLPPNLLAGVLSRYAPTDPRVVKRSPGGEGAAILDVGDQYLVTYTQQVAFATEEIGWYAVHVNANGVATTGATPLWFMPSLLLPKAQADGSLVERIFEQMADAAGELGVSLLGGQAEVTTGISRPIVAGSMLGMVGKDDLVTTDGAREGDRLIVTKGVPIQATAIIARERQGDLVDEVTSAFLDRGLEFLRDPGISVVRDAQVATSAGRVHAMHSPADGGLAAGLWQMAEASGKRLVVDCSDAVIEEGVRLCKLAGINPLGASASGALLLSVHPDSAQDVVSSLESEGIQAHLFGRVEAGPVEVINTRGGEPKLLERPLFDDVTRLFE